MKTSLLAVLCVLSQGAMAQSHWEDTMYAEGKINVVIAVVAIIFLGLMFFLWNTDRKVKKLEQEFKK